MSASLGLDRGQKADAFQTVAMRSTFRVDANRPHSMHKLCHVAKFLPLRLQHSHPTGIQVALPEHVWVSSD
jgi:hypothetical protein